MVRLLKLTMRIKLLLNNYYEGESYLIDFKKLFKPIKSWNDDETTMFLKNISSDLGYSYNECFYLFLSLRCESCLKLLDDLETKQKNLILFINASEEEVGAVKQHYSFEFPVLRINEGTVANLNIDAVPYLMRIVNEKGEKLTTISKWVKVNVLDKSIN